MSLMPGAKSRDLNYWSHYTSGDPGKSSRPLRCSAVMTDPKSEPWASGFSESWDPPDRRPVFAETWPLLEEMVETEEDDDVLYWVLSCLWYTGNPRIIDTLVGYSSHPKDDIRQTICLWTRWLRAQRSQGR